MLPHSLAAQDVPADIDRWNAAAMEWVDLLRAGDYEAAAELVDPEVPAGAMNAERLAAIWAQVTAQLGTLTSLRPGPVSETGEYHLADLPAAFQNQELVVRVVLTDSLEVSGFSFQPAEPPSYEAPAYVDTTAFREEAVTVGEEPWELPGVLSVPAGAGPFPAVVLVHGSGPNDRDGTLGGNRPLRDLAWGLASRGIAVLRYDKRTRTHGATLAPGIGLEEEVIEDAVHALALLRGRQEVDGSRVFVAGHSLGGLMTPTIAERDGELAGAIVLAGPARPFLDVIRSQLEYIAGLEPDPESPRRVALHSILADVRTYAATGSTPNDSLLNVPVAYWEELRAVDPVATARDLSIPMLILQGGRDYQVTAADLALWRDGLDRANVVTRLYPDLNHLFAPGEGMATPDEYTARVAHVAGTVIEDVAAWVREQER